MAVKFYVLSIKHTHAEDVEITLWCSKDCGYATVKEYAGLYDDPKEGYHDDIGNMPVSEVDAARLFKVNKHGKSYLPNTTKVWAALGVKRTKKGLTRLITEI